MPGDRGSLAQELQRELARVGCYDGQINGVWTASTRQAMKAFLERVNATLPVDQPDGVLLALVQGQRVKTCGTPCPSGQAFTEDGRCMPTAILSREAQKDHAKKATLATSGWSTTTTVAPKLPSVPLEGQMALAGPKAESTADVVKTEPVQPARARSPTAHHSGRDWRSELWKRQQAGR
jgi:peptidoglycan hydrolase-like protein with peptidoglycan-binding domain